MIINKSTEILGDVFKPAGDIITGTVDVYANLPDPATQVGKFWFVRNNSGGLLSALGVYKYPRGFYSPNASLVWEEVPLNVKYSEDAVTNVNITDWSGFADYVQDIAIGDRVIYDGYLYKNITGVATATAPDLDTTNWSGLDGPRFTNTVWVSKKGNDATGTVGDINSPFLTIQAAIDAVTTAGPTNECGVIIDGGLYFENLTLKSYLYLCGQPVNVGPIIISNVGPVITMPDGPCKLKGMDVVLQYPMSDNQVVVYGYSTNPTSDWNFENMNIAAYVHSSTPFRARLIDTTCHEFRYLRSNMLYSNAYTGSIYSDTVLVTHRGGRVVHQVVGSEFQIYQTGPGNITVYDCDSASLSGLVSIYALVFLNTFGFIGEVTWARFVGASINPNSIFTCYIFFAALAGSLGKAIVVDVTAPGYVNIDALNNLIDIQGFVMPNSALLGRTGNAANILSFSFCSIGTSLTWVNSPGTINVNTLQGNEFKTNTNFIDVNSLIGNPTNQGFGEFLNIGFSAGWVSGGIATDNLDGTVNITAGTGMIRSINDEQGDLLSFDHAGVTNLALTSEASNYVYIDYNAGSPQIQVTLNRQDILDNENDKYELYEIYKEGTTSLHLVDHRQRSKNVIGKIQQYLYSISGITRADFEGGLIIGESRTANRYVTVTAGKVWIKLIDSIINEINTDPGSVPNSTFDGYYRNGTGGWIKQTGLRSWNFILWDNGSGVLQTIPSNRYSYNDFWVESDGHMIYVYPQNYYTSQVAAAEAPLASVTPYRLESHAIYIGRIVFQTSTFPALEVLSAFDISLSSAGATDHGTLSGILDDDHTIYFLLAGRSGGQIARGGTDASNNLTLESTSNATKGKVIIQPNGGMTQANDDFTLLKFGTPSYPYRLQNNIDSLYMYVGNTAAWFFSEQAENTGDNGGFRFVMDNDGTATPTFQIGLKNAGTSFLSKFSLDYLGTLFAQSRLDQTGFSLSTAIAGVDTDLPGFGTANVVYGTLTKAMSIVGAINFAGHHIFNIVNTGLNFAVAGFVMSDVSAYGNVFGLEVFDIRTGASASAGDVFGAHISKLKNNSSNYTAECYGLYVNDLTNISTSGNLFGLYINNINSVSEYSNRTSYGIYIGSSITNSIVDANRYAIYSETDARSHFNGPIEIFSASLDALISLSITGVTNWSLGIDNSDSDKFKISLGAALGTNDALVIDASRNIGIGTSSPNAVALLELDSTSKGLLLPRMNTVQRDDISNPPDGLMIFNTMAQRVQVRTSGGWLPTETSFVAGGDTHQENGTFNSVVCSGGLDFSLNGIYKCGVFNHTYAVARITSFMLPDDFDSGTDIDIEIKWTSDVTTGYAVIGIGAISTSDGDGMTSFITYQEQTSIAPDTGYKQMEFTKTFNNLSASANDVVGVVIYRHPEDVNDTMEGAFVLVSVALRYRAGI